tara:strand:- start:552 stop:881 length:330 start_codon:yes stop_codon:yes gene_type:complete
MSTPPLMQVLYFTIGFAIAAVLVFMLGCTPSSSDSGVYRQPEIILLPEAPPLPKPKMCCAALIPSCEACKENISVKSWLRNTCGEGATDAEYAGWDDGPVWLCQMTFID